MGSKMLTNEELVERIKAGETELMSDLWLQIDAFVRQQAYKFASGGAWADRCRAVGITHEDLYCAGYFALEPAIQGFSPDKGRFLTYFGSYALKRAFYTEIGVRRNNKKWYTKPDTLGSAQSLEETVYEGKDGGSITLEDYLVDESAQKPFDDIEDKLYNQDLHDDLEEALNSLRPRDAELIRDHYYNLLSVDAQAKKYNLSRSRVDQIRSQALSLLKKHAKLQSYRARIIGSISSTGYQAWKESGMSQPERIVIKLEEYERMLGLK